MTPITQAAKEAAVKVFRHLFLVGERHPSFQFAQQEIQTAIDQARAADAKIIAELQQQVSDLDWQLRNATATIKLGVMACDALKDSLDHERKKKPQ